MFVMPFRLFGWVESSIDSISARTISTRRLRRMRDAVRGRDEQLPLAAADGDDVLGSDPVLDQSGADEVGALARQLVVDLIRADGIGVTDDQ